MTPAVKPVDKTGRSGMAKRILVVDDSSMMRKMIKKTLTEAGHDVVADAKNGKEALDYYMSLSPDVVTMDITMRDLDGIAAARKIIEYDEKARIIFLSNLDQEKYGEDALAIGAIGYVNKNRAQEILQLIEQQV